MYRGITLLILSLLVAAALYAPIQIPYDLVSVGHVAPAEEWLLMQDGSGGLLATHQNFKTGVVERVASWQFERGDLSGMEVMIPRDAAGQIRLGDTLVCMYSAVIQQQILELENQLNIKQSERQVAVTGEKPPIVQEAETRLSFAKQTLTLREKEYVAAQQLVADQVLARLEFIRIENALELARIEVKTAENALENARTGLKMESVDLNASEISALRKQLDFLRRRNAGYVIRSPFDGVVAPIREVGEVLILQKVSEYVLSIPVKSEEMAHIGDSAVVQISDPLSNQTYTARYLYKLPQTQVLGGRSVGFLQAIIQPQYPGERIALGTSAKCIIHCGALTPRAYLKRILHFSVNKN